MLAEKIRHSLIQKSQSLLIKPVPGAPVHQGGESVFDVLKQGTEFGLKPLVQQVKEQVVQIFSERDMAFQRLANGFQVVGEGCTWHRAR